MNYQDILYEVKNHVAYITINRPEKYNAFTQATCEELISAFHRAGWDNSIGAVVLSGSGDKAFCTGGDQSSHAGSYGDRGTLGMPLDELHTTMRDIPKPVIAKVSGFAIGGGNVLASVADMTIAADNAVFGQVGPKVGSVDPGYGTAYLSRVVGEKKAREMWYMCRKYSAVEALQMGLINRVVPLEDLDAEVESWCAEIIERSPNAIAIAKRSFNADTDHIKGIGGQGLWSVRMYYETDESQEGVDAFIEKRKPDFNKFRK